jgi:hypothetical protein
MVDSIYGPQIPPENVDQTTVPSPKDPYEERAKGAMDEYGVSMKALQAMMPQIDYEKTFGHYLKKQDETPMTRMPGRGEAFSRAFGSEGGNESVLQQIQQAHQEKRSLHQQHLETERDILSAKVKQEMDKGNADNAMKAQAAKRLLDYQLDAINDERKNKQQLDLEDKKGRDRAALQEKKLAAMGDIAKDKIMAMIKTHGGDDKMALAKFNWFMKTNYGAMKSLLDADPILGSAVSPAQTSALAGMVTAAMEDYDKSHGGSSQPTGGSTTTVVSGSTSGSRTRLQQIADRKTAERK